MWMVGYNEGGGELDSITNSLNGRKLRPLVPRPPNAISTNINNNATTTPPCLTRIHGTDLFAINHHLSTVADQSKREFNAQSLVVSSRWNPTPEQLRTLEDLYRRGTRTPSADQIQHITAQLRRYGKIEGKNVFYWFQNHKARERQKRRRQLESAGSEEQQHRDINEFGLEGKESGQSRAAVFEVEQTKNWTPATNCSSTLAEESVPIIQRGAARGAVAECRTNHHHGWVQFDQGKLLQQQHRMSLVEKNATWQMMELYCPPTTTTTTTPHLINSTTTTTTASTAADELIKAQDLNLLCSTSTATTTYIHCPLYHFPNDEEKIEESQTLQLFPLGSNHDGDGNNNLNEKERRSREISDTAMNTPHQFFEFLPLKN